MTLGIKIGPGPWEMARGLWAGPGQSSLLGSPVCFTLKKKKGQIRLIFFRFVNLFDLIR